MLEKFQIFDKKLLILYILDTAKKHLSIDQITNLCLELGNITYFDVCEYIEYLRQNDFIDIELSDDIALYFLTEKGDTTLKELIELIPGVDLYKLKKMISNTITEIKKEYEIGASLLPIKDGRYKVNCYIKDDNEDIFNINLFAGNKETAKTISKNWQENSENIHAKILDMLTEE